MRQFNYTMPLDSGQFNMVTEGSSLHKEELLQLFFQSVEEYINILQSECNPGNSANWVAACSDLKEISASIGAIELAKICSIAEKMTFVTKEKRLKILLAIKESAERLRSSAVNAGY